MVDIGDLKSPGHRAHAGSSPAPGTKTKEADAEHSPIIVFQAARDSNRPKARPCAEAIEPL